jgi:NTE family protein
MSGGGARAAYQVGVLRALAKRLPELEIPFLTGVSAGAINAVFLASYRGALESAAARLSDLWGGLRTEDVLVAEPAALAGNVVRWGARLVSGGSHVGPAARGMVDTTPLRRLLGRTLVGSRGGDSERIPGIAENLRSGTLEAVAVTTTNYSTGQSVTWVDGPDFVPWQRPFRVGVKAELNVEHILASSALPLVFPAIQIGTDWHGDGGIRLTAPLAPALHLGADRILVIGTRRARPSDPRSDAAAPAYPPPAQIAGVMMNTVFLDMLDEDVTHLSRMNALIKELPNKSASPFRQVDVLVIRPTLDLARLAREHEHELPTSFRFLTRGWGTKELASPDTLSMLMFEGGYARALMDLGEADATARMGEIVAFLSA